MVLLIILLTLVVFMGIIGFTSEPDGWRLDGAGVEMFTTAVILGIPFIVIQGIGLASRSSEENVTYSVPIVSLNDGKGMKGTISGGLFVIRGEFQDTQHFSYYRKDPNGSYLLEKRPAEASSIWLDATAETARVDVTDKVYKCKGGSTWWFLGCGSPSPEFVHADFHVPANSIVNQFLDAE